MKCTHPTQSHNSLENSYFRRIPEALLGENLHPMAGWLLTVISLKTHRFNNLLIATNEQLADWSGMSRGSVMTHVKALEDAGLVVVLRRKKKANRYILAGMMADYVCGEGHISTSESTQDNLQETNANEVCESVEVQDLDSKLPNEVQHLDAKQELNNKQDKNTDDDVFIPLDLEENSEMKKDDERHEMLREFGVRGAMVDKLAKYPVDLLRLKMGEARMNATMNPVGYLVRMLENEPIVATPALPAYNATEFVDNSGMAHSTNYDNNSWYDSALANIFTPQPTTDWNAFMADMSESLKLSDVCVSSWYAQCELQLDSLYQECIEPLRVMGISDDNVIHFVTDNEHIQFTVNQRIARVVKKIAEYTTRDSDGKMIVSPTIYVHLVA